MGDTHRTRYEVYIEAVHHLKHGDETERKIQDATTWAESMSPEPTEAERLRCVVNALRSMADTYDPDVTCFRCGRAAHEHENWPEPPFLCADGNVMRLTKPGRQTVAHTVADTLDYLARDIALSPDEGATRGERERSIAEFRDNWIEVAGELKRLPIENFDDCCPVCQEVTCDDDCPLSSIRDRT